MKLSAYIATPITGIPEMNRPMVDSIAKHLLDNDIRPIIPHDVAAHEHAGPCPGADEYPGVTGQDHTGFCYLRADLVAMLQADFVVMAPGWNASRGATVERNTALAVKMSVVYYNPETGRTQFRPLPQDRDPAFGPRKR